MPQCKVRRYNMGIWDKQEPQDIQASSSKEAAGKSLRRPLIVAGTIGKLRAEVWQDVSPLSGDFIGCRRSSAIMAPRGDQA
jgi:hypothetical protein